MINDDKIIAKRSTFYIFMRDDLDSLNPGKGMAQAAHAAQMFDAEISGYRFDECSDHVQKYLTGIESWRGHGGSFGTTIVLACNGDDIYNIIDACDDTDNNPFVGVVHDRTYPINDGSVTHYIPLDTCAWAFILEGEEIPHLISKLGLYR